MKDYKIIGTLSPNAINFGNEKEGYFSGLIVIMENGDFTGEIQDIYGESLVKGALVKGKLEFKKTYFSGVSNGLIFLFHLHKKDELSGFYGEWSEETNVENLGKVYCAVFSVL